MARIARDLQEAYELLDIRPLQFGAEHPADGTEPSRYVERPGRPRGGRPPLREMDKLRDRLLRSFPEQKLFLSGHVGCGKSTELARLAADDQVRERFLVAAYRFEEEEWAYLDSSQVLFRLAAELYALGEQEGLLGSTRKWKAVLQQIDAAVYQPTGARVEGVDSGFEVNAFFVKFRQDWKLSDARRRRFREFGETNQSLLQDLVAQLLDDLSDGLARRGDGRHLLVIVDDLDKVREAERVEDIFHRNLNGLLQPPVTMLCTVPRSVLSTSPRLRDGEHLQAVRVLEKVEGLDEQQAFDRGRLGFFEEVLAGRLEPGLVEPGALEVAALYSGGVIRDFLQLLREATLWSLRDGLDRITAEIMEEVVGEERRKLSYALYPDVLSDLSEIHDTHQIHRDHLRYLDVSWVLECYNGGLWYEVAPILWRLLPEE